jgi:hypothetical protein
MNLEKIAQLALLSPFAVAFPPVTSQNLINRWILIKLALFVT